MNSHPPPMAAPPPHGNLPSETALHEAGHAVVAWHRGLAVHTVSIAPDHDQADGVVLHHNPWHDLDGSPADALHAAVVAAEVSYAGDLAVRACLGRPGEGCAEDTRQVAAALGRVCASREELRRMAAWVEQRVRELLERPRLRAAVLAVAHALDRERSLDADAFSRLVAAPLDTDGSRAGRRRVDRP